MATYKSTLPSGSFIVRRSAGGTPETFTFFCAATTRQFNQEAEVETYLRHDCDDPSVGAVEGSVVKSRRWDVTLSGACVPEQFALLQADYNSAVGHRWQIDFNVAGASGGGVYVGTARVTKLDVSSQAAGVVNFSATLRGDGPLAFTAAA